MFDLRRPEFMTLFGGAVPRVGIASYVVPDAAAVAERLATRYGIGVRAGQFCAHPLARRLTARRRTA